MSEPTPTRVLLRGQTGRPVLSYLEIAEARVAIEAEVLGPGAAEAVLAQLPGWTVSGSASLADELAAHGGIVQRRFQVLRRAISGELPPGELPPGYRAVGADRPARDLLPAWHAAYLAEGHPDAHTADPEAMLAERLVPVLDGGYGAVLPWSRLALDADGAVVAGVIALEVPALGAWLGDVFRDPAPHHAGLGGALLGHVLHLAAGQGVTGISLAVSEGNPAGRVYRRLGFELVQSMGTVTVPG
jgi:GNAT superfamily N-acetyltransferase